MVSKFVYHAPKSLQEALDLMSSYGRDAKPLAGGTDLLVDLREKKSKPKAVIDLKNIKELNKLSYERGSGLVIGATVTYEQILSFEPIRRRYTVLWEAVKTIADEIIRMRATLVGNICTSSPAADTAPPLLVYDAVVKTLSKNGAREIPIEKFFIGVKKNVLEAGEIVESVYLPEPLEDARGAYLKAMRTWSEDLALVGVAVLVADRGRDVRLAYASVAPTPVRARKAEDVFRGDGPLREKIEQAVEIAAASVSPITDVRASKEYRLHLVKTFTRNALLKLLGTEVVNVA
ncbi:molybdenum hydroxylase family protein, medium subunit [Candidatus Caldarchaeum subterraneum]|uniref:Molybdenum hydroxylase family protein, medium subunit n=1 Tax=Caldiarchaeum subterraneum TaxID=311458 RepID=E6N5K1_CALS0|nr:molybdenum hydroxylase family protein, medium subunit [Candidatus Caldarchaeum subterraneum]BAJ50384.1 molybdenum hydroxylase family protein, medium subunit [Candidatus Caldarchaeum subterraneum]